MTFDLVDGVFRMQVCYIDIVSKIVMKPLYENNSMTGNIFKINVMYILLM